MKCTYKLVAGLGIFLSSMGLSNAAQPHEIDMVRILIQLAQDPNNEAGLMNVLQQLECDAKYKDICNKLRNAPATHYDKILIELYFKLPAEATKPIAGNVKNQILERKNILIQKLVSCLKR